MSNKWTIRMAAIGTAFPAALLLVHSPALAAGTAANAGPFLKDMLTRGIASVRGWPDDAIASPIDTVQFDPGQQCALVITAKNGHKFPLQLNRAASVGIKGRPQVNVNSIEILGGTAPFDSVSIYVDDDALFQRVANAFTVLHGACDKSAALGF